MQLATGLLMAVALMAIALRYPLPDLRRRAREIAVLVVVVLPTMPMITAAGAVMTLGLPRGLALAFLVLGLSALLHAELLSVLVAGLLRNRVVGANDREAGFETDETLNQFVVVPVFLLLGATLPWADWAVLGWAGPLFVLVALMLRRLPVVLSPRRPLRAGWAMRRHRRASLKAGSIPDEMGPDLDDVIRATIPLLAR